MLEQPKRPSMFVEGWLNDRFAAGRRPTYAYPSTRLPDAGDRRMEVVTSFLGARKPKPD